MALGDMKFSAAHFVACRGFREPLHGHNYTMGVRIGGAVQADGYIVDFGDVKKAARKACRGLNHRTLLPMHSDALQVRTLDGQPPQVEVRCEGGAAFTFPAQDCALLPVVHTTAEELAEYLFWVLADSDGLGALLVARGIHWMEVYVSERPGQGAKFRSVLGRPRSSLPSGGAVLKRPLPKPCFGHDDGPLDAEEVVAPTDTARLSLGTQALARARAAERRKAAPTSEADQTVARQEAAYAALLESLGPDEASRPEVQRTPYRAAKAWREMTSGIKVTDPMEVIGEAIFDVEEARDLVAIRDIPFHSLCEHHLLPFSGIAHVAYFPEGKVLGLSKFPRLLQVYSRRLQLQERLTAQFADVLQQVLQPKALAVAMEATHACMCVRGVGVNASTRTLALRGPGCREPALKEELGAGIAFSTGGGLRARL